MVNWGLTSRLKNRGSLYRFLTGRSAMASARQDPVTARVQSDDIAGLEAHVPRCIDLDQRIAFAQDDLGAQHRAEGAHMGDLAVQRAAPGGAHLHVMAAGAPPG